MANHPRFENVDLYTGAVMYHLDSFTASQIDWKGYLYNEARCFIRASYGLAIEPQAVANALWHTAPSARAVWWQKTR